MTDATFHTPAHAIPAARARNPFVPISETWRAIIVAYFLGWRAVPTLAQLSAQGGVEPAQALIIALLALLTELLILLPFLLRRFAGTPIGWLHPLILPTVVAVVFGLLRRPETLLAPVTVWYQGASVPEHQLLLGWPASRILDAQLRLNLIHLIALICTYLGFALVLGRRERAPRPPRINGARLCLLFLAAALVAVGFVHLQGGLVAHMTTLGDGRFRMRQFSGHFLVINAFLPLLLLLWYAYRPGALANPAFLLAFAAACVMQFVVTGSRSDLFMPLAMLLAVWIYHNRKIPGARAILLGFAAFLLLGTLGEIRRSGSQGMVDFTALREFDLAAAWAISRAEQDARRRDTGLAIAALVPEVRDHLYGATYLGAATFFVPRALWPEKPRGAGAHAAALVFQGDESVAGYEGGGFPVTGAPEAYWNFGYPAVVVVFLLFGFAMGQAARWLLHDPASPYALVVLLLAVFQVNTPNTTSLVPMFQSLVLLYLVSVLTGRVRMR